MTKEEFTTILDRNLDGTATEEERCILDNFYQQEMETARYYWQEWKLSNGERLKAEMYRHLMIKVAEAQKPVSLWRKTYTRMTGIAAAVLVMVSLGYVFFSGNESHVEMITKSTEENQRASFTLSDGSTILLNENSTISYPEKFDKSNRKVTLTGEAFFEISRDEARPFTIQSGEVRTTVLGTSFNISAYAREDIEVSVVTGKVRVDVDGTGKEAFAVLTPGAQAVYHAQSQTLEQRLADPDIQSAWTFDRMVFDGVTFHKALAMLENKYDVKIQTKGLRSTGCQIVGEHENESLENILKSMQYTLDFKLL